MNRKRYSSVHCVIVLLYLVGGSRGHLLPQALEDVHAYVQSELQRSQGRLGSQMALESAPVGGPIFHATQTFVGTPITVQKEIRFNGNGGVQNFNGDQHASPSQNFGQVQQAFNSQAENLPTGLIPPVPLEHPQNQQQQQQTSASNERPQIFPANVVGPSTFVSDAPKDNYRSPSRPVQSQVLPQQQQPYQPPQQQQPYQLPLQQAKQENDRGMKTMEGWQPLDNEGSTLARGVGVKLQVTEEEKPQVQSQNQGPSYRGIAYSIRRPSQQSSDGQNNAENNDIDIVQTNSVKLQDIIVGTKKLNLKERRPPPPPAQQQRHPVYPRATPEVASPKVVIHAQNVIIRGNDEADSPLDITATSNNASTPSSANVKSVPAYSAVPQLNNFLRDQLRFAAMNQLLQSQLPEVPIEHPLANQQFPRPLSLREIAQAVRNGQFPTDPRQDPLVGQPSLISPHELQINIPHVVQMNPDQAVPDALPLASIDSHPKIALPGVGLGNLYKNILQQEVQGAVFDPRDSLEYSLLAALHGQKLKAPVVPKFKAKPHIQSDYGDSVAYSGTKDPKNKGKEPIQILSAAPIQQSPGHPGSGSLRQMQDHLLKQLLLQELQEEVEEDKLRRPQPQIVQQHQQVLLPVGLQLQRPAALLSPGLIKHSGLRHVPYGTNAHPFAYLAEEQGVNPEQEHVFEETIEYTLPPGANLDDFLRDDGQQHYGPKKRPRGPPRHRPHYGGPGIEESDPDGMPLNKDTLMTLGKGLLSSALEFSRHHNPLTVLSRIRSLPPVKVDLYKVPMGIPEGLVERIPEKWRSGSSGSPYGGSRGKRKHLPRKNNPKYY